MQQYNNSYDCSVPLNPNITPTCCNIASYACQICYINNTFINCTKDIYENLESTGEKVSLGFDQCQVQCCDDMNRYIYDQNYLQGAVKICSSTAVPYFTIFIFTIFLLLMLGCFGLIVELVVGWMSLRFTRFMNNLKLNIFYAVPYLLGLQIVGILEIVVLGNFIIKNQELQQFIVKEQQDSNQILNGINESGQVKLTQNQQEVSHQMIEIKLKTIKDYELEDSVNHHGVSSNQHLKP